MSVLGSTVTQLSVDGVTFTPQGVPVPPSTIPRITPRTTFDDRTPYPYDFISGNLLQIASTELQIDFSTPVTSFGFGAALDATANPGTMQIDLFDSAHGSLGTYYLTLDRTLVSQLGGTNSNSEGLFFVDGLAETSRALITSFGDGTDNGSEFYSVIDNVTFQPTPEPSCLCLAVPLVIGLFLAVVNAAKRGKRRRAVTTAA